MRLRNHSVEPAIFELLYPLETLNFAGRLPDRVKLVLHLSTAMTSEAQSQYLSARDSDDEKDSTHDIYSWVRQFTAAFFVLNTQSGQAKSLHSQEIIALTIRHVATTIIRHVATSDAAAILH